MQIRKHIFIARELAAADNGTINKRISLPFTPTEVIVKALTYSNTGGGGALDEDKYILRSTLVGDPLCLFFEDDSSEKNIRLTLTSFVNNSMYSFEIYDLDGDLAQLEGPFILHLVFVK